MSAPAVDGTAYTSIAHLLLNSDNSARDTPLLEKFRGSQADNQALVQTFEDFTKDVLRDFKTSYADTAAPTATMSIEALKNLAGVFKNLNALVPHYLQITLDRCECISYFKQLPEAQQPSLRSKTFAELFSDPEIVDDEEKLGAVIQEFLQHVLRGFNRSDLDSEKGVSLETLKKIQKGLKTLGVCVPRTLDFILNFSACLSHCKQLDEAKYYAPTWSKTFEELFSDPMIVDSDQWKFVIAEFMQQILYKSKPNDYLKLATLGSFSALIGISVPNYSKNVELYRLLTIISSFPETQTLDVDLSSPEYLNQEHLVDVLTKLTQLIHDQGEVLVGIRQFQKEAERRKVPYEIVSEEAHCKLDKLHNLALLWEHLDLPREKKPNLAYWPRNTFGSQLQECSGFTSK